MRLSGWKKMERAKITRTKGTLHTIGHGKVEDGVHQHTAFPEMVTHVLQPAGVQTAHCLAVLGDLEGDGDGIVLPTLLLALRSVEKGEDLHFCGDLEKGWRENRLSHRTNLLNWVQCNLPGV